MPRPPVRTLATLAVVALAVAGLALISTRSKSSTVTDGS